MEKNDLEEFINSLERKELTEEQQVLLSFGGDGPVITINNNVTGCSTTNNCNNGNCGNCVKGCGVNS
ncbi:hypothetical protein [uncultured Phocaeicola sp.]|uniref:hypothetical protein n=1 Tax=uncultured Phocaeicola sp. TaxID=990718 RepID=UPI0014345117|nr:hypothetical protein [uncultured Phocaeicola sp.]GFH98029.1 hypothetical protein IMSAGC004_00415 [Bacteroidaceae bacterium]